MKSLEDIEIYQEYYRYVVGKDIKKIGVFAHELAAVKEEIGPRKLLEVHCLAGWELYLPNEPLRLLTAFGPIELVVVKELDDIFFELY